MRSQTQDIVEQVAPSTVRVKANFRGQQSEGSGWVLDAGDGLVVTNFHVVSGGTEFDVIADGDSSDADLVAAAPCEDLALLKADETEGLEPLPLGSGADLRQGERVVALGYPANLSLGEDISSTAGVISVVTSSERLPVPDSPTFEDLVQTDAPLNPGNSGGPLVNEEGKLVGVNTAILTELGGQPIQGQGYAIGVDRVKEVVAELRRGRSAGWFGTGLVVPPRASQRRERLRGILATGAVPGTSGFENRLEGALVDAASTGAAWKATCRATATPSRTSTAATRPCCRCPGARAARRARRPCGSNEPDGRTVESPHAAGPGRDGSLLRRPARRARPGADRPRLGSAFHPHLPRHLRRDAAPLPATPPGGARDVPAHPDRPAGDRGLPRGRLRQPGQLQPHVPGHRGRFAGRVPLHGTASSSRCRTASRRPGRDRAVLEKRTGGRRSSFAA